MTKSDKRLGKVKPKHLPQQDVPRLPPKPAKSPKKPRPRYRVEHYWGGLRWIKQSGGWFVDGYAKTLSEAEHLMKKRYRSFAPMKDDHSRIVDTETGQIIAHCKGANA